MFTAASASAYTEVISVLQPMAIWQWSIAERRAMVKEVLLLRAQSYRITAAHNPSRITDTDSVLFNAEDRDMFRSAYET